jgi:hypothetical protein
MSNYANAKDVLPKELFQQVREHFPAGGSLYVPGTGNHTQANRQIVLNLFEHGTPSADIAGIMGITRRRVNQIIAERNNGI